MGIEGIGARVVRKEDKRFITCKGRYVDDVKLVGMTFAHFIRSPHAHAKVKSIDASAALKMPGVIAVLNGKELVDDKIGNLICGWATTSKDGSPMKMGAWPAMAPETVRFVGQAVAVGERLAGVRLAAAVTSPLERCRETCREITRRQAAPLRASSDKQLSECDYGDWQGRALKDLAKEKLWRTVQAQPSAATFPGGESMRAMQDRAVAAVRRHDARVAAEHGDDAVWLAVSHGDVIKSILADALGLHLDQFQRLHVDPASVSVIHYGTDSSMVLQTNSHAGDLSWLAPKAKKSAARKPVIGGGAGPSATS